MICHRMSGPKEPMLFLCPSSGTRNGFAKLISGTPRQMPAALNRKKSNTTFSATPWYEGNYKGSFSTNDPPMLLHQKVDMVQ